jgi:protein-L-isoaspartate(D-aspartate) O-methyltransferase
MSRAAERERMVLDQLARRGIEDTRVLAAMRSVPRHRFVPDRLEDFAYDDRPLPICYGQAISQPFMVARMTEALQLQGGERVLEIGTGSGYQAAVLAELARRVYSIEIVPELAAGARRVLAEAGYDNVEVREGNGHFGWPGRAPFPRIIVTAAPPEIPRTLVDQLAVGGRMVLPVGVGAQEIVLVSLTADGVREERALPVRFVPMVDPPPE